MYSYIYTLLFLFHSWDPLTLLTAARRLQLTTKVRLSLVSSLYNEAQLTIQVISGLLVLFEAEEKMANSLNGVTESDLTNFLQDLVTFKTTL